MGENLLGERTGNNSSANKKWPHLLRMAALCASPSGLVALVTGSGWTALLAVPAFALVFLVEVFRSGRDLFWVGAVLLPPTVLVVPIGMAIRQGTIQPWLAHMTLLVFLPLMTLVGYPILAGLNRWLRSYTAGLRWGALYAVGFLLGATPAGWIAIRGQLQEAQVQDARRAFVKKADALETEWSVSASVRDLAPTGSGVLMLGAGTVTALSRTGRRGRTVKVSGLGLSHLHAGQFDADSLSEMVARGEGSSDTLRAFDHDGRLLWTYAVPGGGTLGSVALADLNGDGLDEVSLGAAIGGGFGAATGGELRVLTPQGRTIWADTTLWVSDVAASGSEGPDGTARVLAATGETIEVYRADGTHVRKLTPDLSAVRVFFASDPSLPRSLIMAVGEGPRLVGLTLDGRRRWRRHLPASEGVGSAASCRGRLAATGKNGGDIYVYDLWTGAPLAFSSASQSFRGVGWVGERSEVPLLTGWTDSTLVGLRP